MTPSWYDVLGVDDDASTEEVRAAWRAQVADLDPTDRRFALLNEAAAVLLDPARREAYDADRAAAEPVRAPEPEAPASARTSLRKRAPRADPAVDEGPARATRLPRWLPAVLGVLALAVTIAAAWFATQVPSDEEVLEATQAAQAAAERAVVPVLSYDYRTLETDRAAAASYLTDDFLADQYDPLFSQIEENAPSTKTVVAAEVRASGITRGGAERAQVLLFVDQVTTNARTREPVVYRNQVTVTMERVGDEWLIDDLQTTRA